MPTQPRCGDCRFWGLCSGRPRQSGEWRQCGRIEFDEEYAVPGGIDGNYATPPIGDYVRPQDRAKIEAARRELALVEDGSGFAGALKSRADFGCVLFEPEGKG